MRWPGAVSWVTGLAGKPEFVTKNMWALVLQGILFLCALRFAFKMFVGSKAFVGQSATSTPGGIDSAESASLPGLLDGKALGRKGMREIAKKQALKEKFIAQQQVIQENEPEPAQRHTNQSIPKGNFSTPNWLTTDLGVKLPQDYKYDANNRENPGWELTISCGDKERKVTLAELEALPGYKVYDDIPWHCVTGWSHLGLKFMGVPLTQVVGLLGLSDQEEKEWKFAYQSCADGYTCPVFREDLLDPSAFFAIRDGQGDLLSSKHGGPRLAMPHLWGWKSAKWLTKLELVKNYSPGFWENLTCHPRGRICTQDGTPVEERWADGLGLVSNFLTGMANIWHRLLGPKAYAFFMYYGGKAVGKMGSVLLAKKNDLSDSSKKRL